MTPVRHPRAQPESKPMNPIQAPTLLRTGTILAALLAASCALASGTHSGGHHHGGYVYGEPGIAANVSRTVEVDAADTMRFTPSNVLVKKGQTIRFIIRNSGNVPHEFSLGTEKELQAHYEVMKKFPDMEHDEPNMVSLQPGAQGEVIWRFTKAGTVHFACLRVGHFDAGMKGQIQVGTGAPGMTEGAVRKIDKDAGKITIQHAAIQHMDMPPMTMVFGVQDKSLLDKTRVGAKIRFMAIRDDNGRLTVTDIQPAK